MMAWRRLKPDGEVIAHRDQGNNLALSMSRGGNCQDNAVAESFFGLLKKRTFQKTHR